MLATDGIWREADSPGDDWRAAARPAMVASIAFALAIGAFLVVRRLNGALAAPLAPLPLLSTAATLLLWASAIRLRLRFGAFTWLPAITILLFAVGCSYPGERRIDWLVWLAVFAAYWLIPARRSSPAAVNGELADVLLQQLSRSRTAEGNDVLRGTLVAEFAPGERSATLHVAFCPPFERLPEIEAEAVDGQDCVVKIAQVLHQGARLEVRLSRASTALERVTVEFLATAQ